MPGTTEAPQAIRTTTGEYASPVPRLPTLGELEAAASLIYSTMPPTPQYRWPLLEELTGTELWVKHENFSPLGAFKIRGGLVYFDHLKRAQPDIEGVVCATRGNHGQSVAFAAKRNGFKTIAVVPHGNSREKNAAMRALGAEVIIDGADFQESLEISTEIAHKRGWHLMPSFDTLLARGIGTYGLELFRAAPPLDAVYVPIGLGSGICGTMAARDALGLSTKVIGVVSDKAPAYALSFAAGHKVAAPVSTRIADGMACRTPNDTGFELIKAGVDHIVQVSDDAVESAMRAIFRACHCVAEGAGAATLAALLSEKDAMRGKRVGIVMSGGNIDTSVYVRVLSAN